jgi:16S rRNA processing protein RimM
MLVVGEIRRPHGLKGEISVEPRTDFPDRFVPGLTLVWKRGDQERSLVVESVRAHSGRLLIRFRGIADAAEAAALAGGDLCVSDEQAVPAPEDFYYGHAVEGWTCRDAEGRELGEVTRLEQTSAGPMLEVRTPSGRVALVPFVRPILVRVEADARRLILDPPAGLMDL